MDTSKYEELFISESQEYIEQISSAILAIEKNPSDREAIDTIFRGLHTLKGMAASMGYVDIAQITHMLEDIMEMVKNKKIELYKELIDILLKGNDYIESLIHKQNIDKDVLNRYKGVLRAIKEGGIKEDISVKEKIKPNTSKYSIEVYFESNVMLKSARAFLVIKTLQDKHLYVGTIPDYDAIMKENFPDKFTVLLKKDISDDLIKTIESIPEIKKVKKHIREEKTINNVSIDMPVSTTQIKKDIKVSLERLDNLQNYASELIIARGRLQQLAYSIQNNELITALQGTSKIITSIQDEVMKIRMVPVWQIFDRYPRYVRDLSNKLNKKVNFIIKGRDIELDRTLLNTLADPLLHLLRNSIDHGIESPQERHEKGKNEEGTVILEAKRLKNAVIISVSDDGKGLDINRIIEKILKMGLASEEQLSRMTRQEIFNFITYSGFSTKEKTTDISGRGIGVDAVKNVLKTIGGSLEIHSEKEKGTTFNLKVPLTLAIIKSLIISVSDERYIIPLTHINETIDIKPSMIQKIMGKEVFVLREEIVPIIRISDIFNIEEKQDRDKYSLVIVNIDDNDFALLIDEFIEQTEIVVKPLRGLLAGIKGLAGVTILNDGFPSFIIDVSSIFEMAKVR